MNKYNVVKLLIAVAIVSPVLLQGMDAETDEQLLTRYRLSGALSLPNRDAGRIIKDYPYNAIEDDAVEDFAKSIIAGCNIDPLFEDGKNTNFTNLCHDLIVALEDPNANKIDRWRVEKFLKKAVAQGKISTTQMKNQMKDPQELYMTSFYPILSKVERRYYMYRYGVPSVLMCGLCALAYTWYRKKMRAKKVDDDIDGEAPLQDAHADAAFTEEHVH